MMLRLTLPFIVPSVLDSQRRQARRAAMGRLHDALADLNDVEGFFRLLHAELGRVMDTTGFLLGLYDESSQMVEIVGQIEASVELPGGSFPLGDGFLSGVIRTRQPRHIRRWSIEGPRVQVQYATNTPGLPESTITVPLLVGGRSIGVLSLQSYKPDAYDDDDLFLVQALAAQVAPALAELRRGRSPDADERVSKLQAVLASMIDGLLVLDGGGRIVSLNPPARDIFGSIGAGIILGQPLDREQWGQWPLGARAVGEALGPVLEDLRHGEARRDVDVEINDLGRRVLSFSSSPITDARGGRAGGVVVIRDVTSQRDVARLRDDLLSIAAHDLRTPATVVKIQAQMIQRELEHGKLEAEHLGSRVRMMLDQTDRLTNMLNLLLDLSRVEAGRLDLNLEPTDLVDLVQRVASSVQALSAKHRIIVRAPAPVVGVWDPARLEQVVQNLLTNSIKYSPSGGTVRVDVRSDGREATLSVTDKGLGIAPDELPQLFHRFYRVARTRGLEGSGLGLYVCRAIIAAHGGRIWATSAGPGQGSTFAFALACEAQMERVA